MKNSSPWRTIVIANNSALSYSQENIVLDGDEDRFIPIRQIRTLMVESEQVSLTGALITALIKNFESF